MWWKFERTGLEAAEVVFEEGGDEERQVANELLHLRIARLVDLRHVNVGRQKLGDAVMVAMGDWRRGGEAAREKHSCSRERKIAGERSETVNKKTSNE